MALSLFELIIQNLSKFFLLFISLFLISGLINYLFIKFLKNKVSHSTYLFVSRISTYLVFMAGILYVVDNIIEIDIGATLATLGILSGLLLFPMIPILQNITAGFILIFERPFKEDDIIEINNKLCKIKEISLRRTKVRSLTGEFIIIPNLTFITSNPIINYTAGEFIKSTQTISVLLESDLDEVKTVLESICHNNQNILPNVPKKQRNILEKLFSLANGVNSERDLNKFKPRVFIKSVEKEKITIEIWFWIWDVLQREHITSNFYESVLREFKEKGISLG